MRQQWEKISAKVLTLSQRERLIILAALLTVVWVAFDTLLLTPSLMKQKLYRQEISARQEEAAKLQAQQLTVLKAAQIDPDADREARLASLQQQIAKMDADLQAMGRDLIAPERMPLVLENLLRKDRQLKLVSLKTLPVSGLMDDIASADPNGAPTSTFGIYKHGFQITLEGSYFDLTHYVTTLEATPWRMLWGNLDLIAGTYPKSTLTLTLYTLSLDKAWLRI